MAQPTIHIDRCSYCDTSQHVVLMRPGVKCCARCYFSPGVAEAEAEAVRAEHARVLSGGRLR